MHIAPGSISRHVAQYMANPSPAARHRSFDYCFNFFQAARETGSIDHLREPGRSELSCLHLGFNLASWGMYRGSAPLLKHSVHALGSVIEEIVRAPSELWEIDAFSYEKSQRKLILDVARRLRQAFPGNASDTLVSKTMLGVFGCVPAFDNFFRRGTRLHSFGEKALSLLGDYASANRDEIQRNQHLTIDFATGAPTTRRYTAAKVLDMVFFIEGGGAEVL